nr:MAG TPA: hypothetical protein [Caudoviricetes sp.]
MCLLSLHDGLSCMRSRARRQLFLIYAFFQLMSMRELTGRLSKKFIKNSKKMMF